MTWSRSDHHPGFARMTSSRSEDHGKAMTWSRSDHHLFSSVKKDCPIIINEDFNLFELLSKNFQKIWILGHCDEIVNNDEGSAIGVNGFIIDVEESKLMQNTTSFLNSGQGGGKVDINEIIANFYQKND
jgi:hypothetical protein